MDISSADGAMPARQISFYAGVCFLGARGFKEPGEALPQFFEIGGVVFRLGKRDGWTIYECGEFSISVVMRLQRLLKGGL